MTSMTRTKRRIRTGVRVTVAACAVAASMGVGHAAAAGKHDVPPLVCGAYTQANEDLTGCELLPGYSAVPTDQTTDQGPTFYEDGSWVMGARSGCAPTALCND